jgi:hypothetical protein
MPTLLQNWTGNKNQSSQTSMGSILTRRNKGFKTNKSSRKDLNCLFRNSDLRFLRLLEKRDPSDLTQELNSINRL